MYLCAKPVFRIVFTEDEIIKVFRYVFAFEMSANRASMVKTGARQLGVLAELGRWGTQYTLYCI